MICQNEADAVSEELVGDAEKQVVHNSRSLHFAVCKTYPVASRILVCVIIGIDEKRPDDVDTEMHGVSVLIDPFSAQYLRGTVIDFSDSLTGGGFKMSNPNARQSCGCGKSFTA